MEARVVDHFTKVLMNQPSEMMNVSSLGGRVAELNKKEKKHLKKVGFNKFLQNHPDNFVVFEDTVVLVHGETPITPKSHPLVPQIPAPPTSGAVENTIQSLRSSPTCSLCLETIEIFAFGICFHPLCYSCCTKMRFLCDDKQCHICRARLHEVVFTKRLSPMNQLDSSRFVKDGAHGVLFEDQEIQNKQRKLLAHRCLKCRVEMLDFDEFERHIENKHNQYFCFICVKQCKVFTHERERFSRDDLQLHMTSHPRCEFCDNHYLDNDELLYHLQRHHYSCNICSDENHVYCEDADEYWRHAETEHFVCSHPGCHGNPGFVFANEVDLKTHKIKEHPGSRDERKKDKILDFNFGSARSTPAPPSGPVYKLQEDGSLVCSGVILDGHLRETFGFIKPDARDDFQENIFFNAASCGLDVDDDLRLMWQPGDRVTVHARRAYDEHKSKWRAINVAAFVQPNHNNHYDVIDINDSVDSFPSLGSASAIQTSPLMASWSSVARTANHKFEPNKISKPTQIMKKKQQTGVGKIHENLQPHHGFIRRDANASYEDNIYFNIQSYCEGMVL
nr:uncharacterized protein LOC104266457 [Ciona intestinalis]|eukprot:XP_009861007.1 uncharacterized protein LOC104266457 [Ciona intestinalis]